MPNSPVFINIEYIYYQIYTFLTDTSWLEFFYDTWWWMRIISILITFPLLALVIYLVYQIIVLRKEEAIILRQMLEQVEKQKRDENPAWVRVMAHMASANPNDWKLAIIEADNMLDYLVKTMGYRGESLGERLKSIEPSDFARLDEAWEAHKVRNRIAHESTYVLTEREARQAIANYKAVFDEFNYV